MITPGTTPLEHITRRFRLRDPNISSNAIAQCLGGQETFTNRFYVNVLLVAVRVTEDEVAIFDMCPPEIFARIREIADETPLPA
jgi:hypothetical protein